MSGASGPSLAHSKASMIYESTANSLWKMMIALWSTTVLNIYPSRRSYSCEDCYIYIMW